MAEQKALAGFLSNRVAIDNYLQHFKTALETRLKTIYQGLMQLKAAGMPIDCITPEAAIYLTVKIDLQGKKTDNGSVLETQAAVTSYLLDEASLALVPFYAFGAPANSPWYRLSVGTCKMEEIPVFLQKLEKAIQKLH
jgi:aspartate aminotransferase